MSDTKELSGFPSIDKPWLKYYSEEALQSSVPAMSIYQYLWENNKDHPTDIAINYFGKKTTFKSLFEQIDAVASSFLSIGVNEGDVVTLVTLSCIPSVLCLYALNKIGAAVNFLNVLATKEEIFGGIKEAGSRYIAVLDLFGEKTVEAAKTAGVEKVIVFSLADGMPVITKLGYKYKTRKFKTDFLNDSRVIGWGSFLKNGEGIALTAIAKDPESLCYLAHTSGTTGVPKAVILNDRAFNVVTQHYLLSIPHKRGETFLSMMIPYVVYGVLVNIHMPLCLGLETVIVPKFEPAQWYSYFKKYAINHCCSIPAYFAPITDDKKLSSIDLSSFKTAGMGGEGMSVPLENKLNTFFEQHNSPARVLMGYGMTEVCATAVGAGHSAFKTGSVGIPLEHNEVIIYNNDTSTECKYYESGEICLRCASEMIGYLNNDGEAAKLYRIHEDGKRWIHSGDIGYMDSDGFLFVTGRMKRMIMTVIDGAVYKITPSEVESIIESHPSVLESCVVRMKQGDNYLLKAFVVIHNHGSVSEKELQKHCREHLSENAQPAAFVIVDSLPRTAAGKIDYRRLENEGLS